MPNGWALGWLYVKGNNFCLGNGFEDVALKILNSLGGSIKKVKSGFLYQIDNVPRVENVDIDFIRGIFEAGGRWGSQNLFIPSVKGLGNSIGNTLNEFNPIYTGNGFLITNEAEVFLHILYDNPTDNRSDLYFNKFLSEITGERWQRQFAEVYVGENGIEPFKKRISDSGWDLYLTKLIKKENNIYFFDTDIRIRPPKGFYFELVPRSSIFKSGFMLANSVGIIDMTYRGTIKVPLIKLDVEKPDPILPWRAVQIIPRKFFPIEVKLTQKVDRTIRGEKGFGSTG